MHTIVTMTPDRNEHLKPILKWSGKEVRETFGISPIMLSCWGCMLGWLSKEQAEMLRRAVSTPARLWRAWQTLAHDNLGQDPMPEVLAEELER